jgi:hypothetical protein
VVLQASKDALAQAFERAVSRDLALSIFTADLFTTGNDRDNRAAVRSVSRADLDLDRVAVFGPRGAADKIARGRTCIRELRYPAARYGIRTILPWVWPVASARVAVAASASG